MTELGCERYTQRPFPAYAFRPGRNPHPVADPRGHSYRSRGAPRPPAQRCPAAVDWMSNAPYLFGCDLYNHGYWWEAHEAWEGIWQTCREPRQRHYLQGLIQVANAHLKLALQRPRAVRRLCLDYRAHFQHALLEREHWMGLTLPRWLNDLDAYLARALTLPTPEHDPKSYPFIHLSGPQ